MLATATTCYYVLIAQPARDEHALNACYHVLLRAHSTASELMLANHVLLRANSTMRTAPHVFEGREGARPALTSPTPTAAGMRWDLSLIHI